MRSGLARTMSLGLLGLGTGAAVVFDRRQRAELARRSRILSTPQGTVEVEVTGAGPDVLILHGSGGGFDQGTWIAGVLGLSGHRVIAMSRPGYLGTPDRVTIDEAVELVRGTLDALGADRPMIVAASGGGLAAAAFAMRHPERLGGLVMLSAVSGPVVRVGLPLLSYFARSGSDVNRAIMTMLPTAAGRAMVEGLGRTLAAPERRIAGVLRDIALSESAPAPRGIAVRTLVVHGTSDGSVPFVHATRTMSGCLNGELMTVVGGGHLCFMTHPDVAERVRAFAA